MNVDQSRGHQSRGVISAKRAERMLLDLANMVLLGGRHRDGDVRHFAKRYPEFFDILPYSPAVTEQAQKIPTLRESVKDSFAKHGFEIAAISLELLQFDLRGVWDAPDERSRDWAIFVMRQWYSVNAIAHAMSGLPTVVPLPARETLPSAWLRVEDTSEAAIEGKSPEEVIEMIIERNKERAGRSLDVMRSLPALTPMEAALSHLQRIGHRLRHCPNPGCPAPFFIVTKRGQKFCTPECARPARLESQRRWWKNNCGRAAKKRRK